MKFFRPKVDAVINALAAEEQLVVLYALQRIQVLAWHECRVRYYYRLLGHMLHAHSWTLQYPPTQAKERDATSLIHKS